MDKVYWAFILVGFCMACHPAAKEVEVDYKYDYFPLEIGRKSLYEVDTVLFREDQRDTFRWQYQEIISDTFTDLSGRPAYRIERYIRKNPDEGWRPITVWYAVRQTTYVEQVEDNLRFVKFLFPPIKGQRWEGNRHINNSSELAFYHNWRYEQKFLDSLTSNSVQAGVLEVNDSTELSKRYSISVYARNRGLFYRERWNLRYENTTLPPPVGWLQRANRGYITKMQLIF